MSPQPTSKVEGRFTSYPVAAETLTDEDIETQYGGLLRQAVAAFLEDSSYVSEMLTNGSTVHRRFTQKGTTPRYLHRDE